MDDEYSKDYSTQIQEFFYSLEYWGRVCSTGMAAWF